MPITSTDPRRRSARGTKLPRHAIQFPPSALDVALDETAPCAYCGDPFFLDVDDLWVEDRALRPITCCSDSYEDAVEDMRTWPREVWVAFVADRCGLEIRHVECDPTLSGSWVLDYGLAPAPITLRGAKAFIVTHHRHNAPPAGWR